MFSRAMFRHYTVAPCFLMQKYDGRSLVASCRLPLCADVRLHIPMTHHADRYARTKLPTFVENSVVDMWQLACMQPSLFALYNKPTPNSPSLLLSLSLTTLLLGSMVCTIQSWYLPQSHLFPSSPASLEGCTLVFKAMLTQPVRTDES